MELFLRVKDRPITKPGFSLFPKMEKVPFFLSYQVCERDLGWGESSCFAYRNLGWEHLEEPQNVPEELGDFFRKSGGSRFLVHITPKASLNKAVGGGPLIILMNMSIVSFSL